MTPKEPAGEISRINLNPSWLLSLSDVIKGVQQTYKNLSCEVMLDVIKVQQGRNKTTDREREKDEQMHHHPTTVTRNHNNNPFEHNNNIFH